MYYRKKLINNVLDSQNIGLSDKMKAQDAIALNDDVKMKKLDPLTRLIAEAFRMSNDKDEVIEMLEHFCEQLTEAKKVVVDSKELPEEPLKKIRFGKNYFYS